MTHPGEQPGPVSTPAEYAGGAIERELTRRTPPSYRQMYTNE
jgi:hypothetical protein